MADVRIKNTKILSNEHYTLKKITFDIKKKNGEWETQHREVFDHGNAAAALLYNKDNRTLILTQQFRIPTLLNGNPGGMLLECCAGLLDEGEAPDDTIIREIEEETGYKVDKAGKVLECFTSAGSLTELIYLYIAEYRPEQKVSEGGGLAEEGEEVKVLELPFDDVVKDLEEGRIKDAKTIMLLQYALLKKLL